MYWKAGYRRFNESDYVHFTDRKMIYAIDKSTFVKDKYNIYYCGKTCDIIGEQILKVLK